MEIAISDDLREFVREQVAGGRFPSEDAVVEAALERLRGRGATSPDDWIDDEFLAYCAVEGDDRVALDDVLRGTAKIAGSMAHAIIEDRADRI
ncbi:MAG TPA: hypothetical protein VG406_20380 [Isosphaeraceae bacterium]|nr:hypothetical protein [Isosphaeraceae bacterium]